MTKWKLKTGDTVKIITGPDKGHIGKILKVHRDSDRLEVEGARKKLVRHQKPSRTMPEGGKVERLFPVHVSNVMLWDGKDVLRKPAADPKRSKVVRTKTTAKKAKS